VTRRRSGWLDWLGWRYLRLLCAVWAVCEGGPTHRVLPVVNTCVDAGRLRDDLLCMDTNAHGSGGAGRDPREQEGTGDRPVLRKTVIRPGGRSPSGGDTIPASERMTAMVHELAGLLDGSLRTIGLASRTLDRIGDPASCGPEAVCELGRRLDVVRTAMEEMATLVRAVGSVGGAGAALTLRDSGQKASLGEAVRLACEVMAGYAEPLRVRVETDLSASLEELRAGPIYGAICNAVRNGVESIRQTGRSSGGLIRVIGRMESGKRGCGTVVIDVVDDGVGPPRCGDDGRSPEPLRDGYSTKPGHTGIGLGLVRSAMEELGGGVALLERSACTSLPRTAVAPSSPGAVLRLWMPAVSMCSEDASWRAMLGAEDDAA